MIRGSFIPCFSSQELYHESLEIWKYAIIPRLTLPFNFVLRLHVRATSVLIIDLSA